MIDASCYIAGQKIRSEQKLPVHHPYDGRQIGEVALANRAHVDGAIDVAMAETVTLNRHERSVILNKACVRLEEEAEAFAHVIALESGLALRDTRYEVGRAVDVLRFAAMEALRDDGQIFACDVSPHGKARKIFTQREPHRLVVAITPFNHPLNQVVHKIAPAIAVGAPLILKPSEKTPLTAIRFAELLYDAGLPQPWLSVLLGPTAEVAAPLVTDPRVELVTFTGSVATGKQIAHQAGYKKIALELGGNDPLIVMDDADLQLAVNLAAEGSFRNSGQRCTAVKRILVHRAILGRFTESFVERATTYVAGDPFDPRTMVGTVIDEPAAVRLENAVKDAVSRGAKVLLGGRRRGALMQPTVLADVPRDADVVVCEAFGPLAPILAVDDLDDAIQLANSTSYGLSCGVVTNRISDAVRAVKSIRSGTVNINEVPGYRTEFSPFGGVKDSGLGVKEGVIEAMKFMTTVKTFSLPW